MLEALVASVMLAIGGVALLSVLGQARRSMSDVRRAELQTIHAGQLLSRVSVMSSIELRARVGEHRAGPFTLRVAQLSAALFLVSVLEGSSNITILETRVAQSDSLVIVDRGE